MNLSEEEIRKCLKENRDRGVCLGFMPDEVKKWCNINKASLLYFVDYIMKDDGSMEHEWIGYEDAPVIENDFGFLSDRNIVSL